MKIKFKSFKKKIEKYFRTSLAKLILGEIIAMCAFIMIFIDDLWWFKGLAIIQSSCFMLYICITCNRSDYILSDFKKELNLKANEDEKYIEVQEILSSIEK